MKSIFALLLPILAALCVSLADSARASGMKENSTDSKKGQSEAAQIMFMYTAQTGEEGGDCLGVLIACYSGGRFHQPDDCDAPMETSFQLCGQNGLAGQAQMTDSSYEEVPGVRTLTVSTNLPESQRDERYVGISAAWNPMPRPSTRLTASDPEVPYLIDKLISEDLQVRAICEPVQAVKADIDDNGQYDVLMAFRVVGAVWDYNAPGMAPGGTWILVAVMDVNTPSENYIVLTESSPALSPDWQLSSADVFAVDMNGDGMLEVLWYEQYYESNTFRVFSIDEPDGNDLFNYSYGL